MSPDTPPTLETDRLLLRLPEERDLDDWAAFLADPETTRFIGGVKCRAGTWRAMASFVGCWALRGFGLLTVIEKESGRWAGYVGPWYPEGWPGHEIAWSIAPAFQRRGYAVEAAAACMDWAFDALGWSAVVHCIEPGNVASVAVARKLGSGPLGRQAVLPPFDVTVELYGQSRQEWRRHRGALRSARAPGPGPE